MFFLQCHEIRRSLQQNHSSVYAVHRFAYSQQLIHSYSIPSIPVTSASNNISILYFDTGPDLVF